MPEHLANAIIAKLLRALGRAEIVLSQDEINTLATESIRIEGLQVGSGVRVSLLPNDPVLHTRLALADMQAAMRAPKDVRGQLLPVAQREYGAALALLTPEQLTAFVALMGKPVTDDERAFTVPVTEPGTPARRGVIALIRE